MCRCRSPLKQLGVDEYRMCRGVEPEETSRESVWRPELKLNLLMLFLKQVMIMIKRYNTAFQQHPAGKAGRG